MIISVDLTVCILGFGLYLTFLYPSSVLGNKRPHFGEIFFSEDASKLELRSKVEEGATDANEKTKKLIDLKGNKSS